MSVEDKDTRLTGKPTGPEDLINIRVAHICELMRTFQFKRRDTILRLADEWDLSTDRVRDYSTAAARIVAAEVMDPDRVSADIGTKLEQVIQRNFDQGNDKIVIEASKVWAQIAGAMAPQRHEITAADVTPVKVSRLMREAFGAVGPDEKK